MLKCRILQKKVQEISTPGQPALQKNSARREAVLVGALAHARREDFITAAENVFLAGFLCGDSLSSLLAQLFSNAGNAAPDNEKISPAQLALVRGMARAKEMFNSGRVALVFCGEDTAALAFQNEALALAAKHKAPVVCLIETSLSALGTPHDRARTRSRKAPQQHFPEIAVDGADVVAIFRVAQEAIRRARTGHGPSLIKCVMPDASSASPQDPQESAHDPLAFMEQYLRRRKLWSEEGQRKNADDFTAEFGSALEQSSCTTDVRR
jgi:pyruvate dehydrogenase E1 component alpha subunit